jgi:hypothetical protein
MKEIENIYRIIHDETYNNQVLLDIEISKITDEKLVVGMLIHSFYQYSKHYILVDQGLQYHSSFSYLIS